MDNIQQIADAVQKGLHLVVRASAQQGRTRLTRLRNKQYSDSFHAALALSCGRAKCQCCTATVTIVVYKKHPKFLTIFLQKMSSITADRCPTFRVQTTRPAEAEVAGEFVIPEVLATLPFPWKAPTSGGLRGKIFWKQLMTRIHSYLLHCTTFKPVGKISWVYAKPSKSEFSAIISQASGVKPTMLKVRYSQPVSITWLIWPMQWR